jgi:L-threonylcarbamoyladenylate synthase
VTGRLDFEEALEALVGGGVVAVPTDTVYGLAASLADPRAVERLFALKHRPASSPLPILVDSMHQVSTLGVTWPDDGRRLAEAFWPGALTIVVRVPSARARRVGSATDSAGFRLPDDAVLRRLIERAGPLAVSSANEHREAPCRSADEVLAVFAVRDELSGVLDDGERSGEASSVVDLSSGPWRMVRVGSIGVGVISGLLGPGAP